ncbi:MAG: DUF2232 domain-containing protein [Alphaproteobacteria bacterium]|nr:DUF2232 domain-containing protein [Alphaproteobacteria bacterium]
MAITTLGGFLSATLCLFSVTFPSLIFLSYFTSLPLFLLGLGIGLRSLISAGILATGCIFLFQGPLLFFLFSFVGPAFFVHRALITRKNSSGKISWYPPSFLLRDTTLFAGIIMTLSLGAYIYLTQGENLSTFSTSIVSLLDPQGHIPGAETLLMQIFPFLPGIFTFSWILVMLFNASIAQVFLTLIKANLRPTPSFEAVEMPKSFLITLALSLLLSIVGVGTLELLGKNAALILTLPFFLSGLGIVHFLLHKTAFAKTRLVFFYCSLLLFYCSLLLFLWPALLVIFLGMLRPWIQKLTIAN